MWVLVVAYCLTMEGQTVCDRSVYLMQREDQCEKAATASVAAARRRESADVTVAASAQCLQVDGPARLSEAAGRPGIPSGA